MTWELICDYCGKMIPETNRHIETSRHVFCNTGCLDEYEYAAEDYAIEETLI